MVGRGDNGPQITDHRSQMIQKNPRRVRGFDLV